MSSDDGSEVMGAFRRLTDEQLDELFTGRVPAGVEGLEDVAEAVRALRSGITPPAEWLATAHIHAAAQAAGISSSTVEVPRTVPTLRRPIPVFNFLFASATRRISAGVAAVAFVFFGLGAAGALPDPIQRPLSRVGFPAADDAAELDEDAEDEDSDELDDDDADGEDDSDDSFDSDSDDVDSDDVDSNDDESDDDSSDSGSEDDADEPDDEADDDGEDSESDTDSDSDGEPASEVESSDGDESEVDSDEASDDDDSGIDSDEASDDAGSAIDSDDDSESESDFSDNDDSEEEDDD